MFVDNSVQLSSTKVHSTVTELANLCSESPAKALIGDPAITVLKLICCVNSYS